MKKASVLSTLFVLLGLLGGCDDGAAEAPLSSEQGQEEAAMPEELPPAEAAPAEPAPSEPEASDEEPITAADFEANANEEISLDNLEEQVSELEAQLNQDLGTE